MKSIIFFLFIVGFILIINGIYEEKFKSLQDNVRIEYRFIPRTYYEEQLSNANVSSTFKNMFNKESPWFERMIGPITKPNVPS